MVLCYDCAECQRTMSVEDLFTSFGSSEYTCPGGRTFMKPIVNNADTSPSKFENIECPHFTPIKFDEDGKGKAGREDRGGSGGNKVKVAPGCDCGKSKPTKPVDSRRRASRPDGLECSICGSHKVTNVFNVVNLDPATKQRKAPSVSYKLCRRCSHVVNKYMVLNKVDAVRAIEVGKKRGLSVLDRNRADDGSPVIVRGAGSETFSMEEALAAPPIECYYCGNNATPRIEELPGGRARLFYECSNKKCAALIEVDKGLL